MNIFKFWIEPGFVLSCLPYISLKLFLYLVNLFRGNFCSFTNHICFSSQIESNRLTIIFVKLPSGVLLVWIKCQIEGTGSVLSKPTFSMSDNAGMGKNIFIAFLWGWVFFNMAGFFRPFSPWSFIFLIVYKIGVLSYMLLKFLIK